jgi:uncharacterized protein
MEIEFDPAKSAKNERERGLPFERAAELEWHRAYTVPDRRRDYGEERFLAFPPLQGRLHVACFTIRGTAFRIISFRKAKQTRGASL